MKKEIQDWIFKLAWCLGGNRWLMKVNSSMSNNHLLELQVASCQMGFHWNTCPFLKIFLFVVVLLIWVNAVVFITETCTYLKVWSVHRNHKRNNSLPFAKNLKPSLLVICLSFATREMSIWKAGFLKGKRINSHHLSSCCVQSPDNSEDTYTV